jgi:Reverse transcriptase (RNA-dependent DNA polymerase)
VGLFVDVASAAPTRVRLVPVPKSGGIRWLAELDPSFARAYARLVAVLAPGIERALAPGVLANRVAFADPARGIVRLEPWRSARARFRRALADGVTAATAVVLADVRDCYASIGPDVCAIALRRIGAPRHLIVGLARSLAELEAGGLPGLPVGPVPSAVLANAVLAGADRSLATAGLAHVRWVDDFVAFATEPAEAHRALAVLRFALADLGLELCEAKTRLLTDPDQVASVVLGYLPSAQGPTATLRTDADALPSLHGAHPLVPADGGVDLGRRPARATCRSG